MNNISYEWNHTVFGFSCLAFPTYQNVPRFILVEACIKTSFLFIAKYYSFAYMWHILLIHSSCDGHLYCFHLVGPENNAKMNIFIQVYIFVSVFKLLTIDLRVELLQHIAIFYWVHSGTAKLFFTVATFYIHSMCK